MQSETQQDRSALRWVRGELDQTLQEARIALEDFVDGQKDRIQASMEALHHTHGVLEMVQVYGGAMLAYEMEQLSVALANGQVKRVEGAAEALMLGLVQLPAYLERIESGGADIPLALLPLMNDLRSARDAPLVSETSLFAPKLDALIAAEPVHPGSGNHGLPQLIHDRRSHFHRGLLSWIRGVQVEHSLQQIREVVDALNSAAGTDRFRRLLDAAAALVVVLMEEQDAPALAVKPLFGKLDRVFKQVIDQGEESAMLDFPTDLLKNLLYYVARSDSSDPLVIAVRQAADLENSFAEGEMDADAAGSLGGPDQAMFSAVGDALSEDLRDVKDQLDLFMRSDKSDLTRVTGLAQPIQRIGDTLGMIGRGELRTRLKHRSDELAAAEQSGEMPSEERLLLLAGDLLFVESSLSNLAMDSQLSSELDEPVEDSDSRYVSAVEMQTHLKAAVDEAMVEMAQTKEAILQYLDSPKDTVLLDSVPARLTMVAGVMQLLEMPEAGRLLSELKPYIGALANGDRKAPEQVQSDALADVVIGAECYMQTAINPSQDRERILGYAEEALERLGLGAAEAGEPDETPVDEQLPQLLEEVATTTEAVDEDSDDEIDSEIMAVFAEEAEEELQVVQRDYPKWRDDLEDQEPLSTIRRSFHTLKGSGRLVGAEKIGEFAWSIENLLNRVIDGTLAPTTELFSVLDDAIAVLPVLVGESAKAGDKSTDTTHLEARAQALAAGEIAPEAPLAPAIEIEDQPSADITSDDDLGRISLPTFESSDLPGIDLPSLDDHDVEQMSDKLSLGEELSVLAASSAEAPQIEIREPANTVQRSEIVDGAPVPDSGEDETPPDESILTLDEVVDSDFTGQDAVGASSLGSSLNAVFLSEARDHLSVLDQFINDCREHGSECRFEDSARRAMHTLCGSARTAGVGSMAEVAGELEALGAHMQAHQRLIDGSTLDLLDRSHHILGELAAHVDDPHLEIPDWQSLQEDIKQHATNPPVSSTASDSDFAEEPDDGAPDPELLEIFLEEARELLESLETDLGDWERGDGELEPVMRLQRTLHTMKGGSRLAGISAVGDISHALESVFESVSERRVAGDETLKGLVRHAADALAVDIDSLGQGQAAQHHPGFVERLENAARGKPWEALDASDAVLASDEDTQFSPDSVLLPELDTLFPDTAATEVPEALSAEPSAVEEPGEEPSVDERQQARPQVEEASALESEEPEDEQMASATSLSDEIQGDSALLTDSQLLTDSELLGETSYLTAGGDSASVRRISGDVSGVVQFPGSAASPEEEGFVPRRALPEPEPEQTGASERIRVPSESLDHMVNNAGEVSIYRARLEQQNNTFGFNLGELQQTIDRLRSQLRGLELETEAQILSRHERESEGPSDFDPLELDRYSTMQQLSRALSETVEDLSSLGQSLNDLSRDTDTLLQQQARVNTDLQDSLLRTRMVKFASRVPRLERVVRQTSHSVGKQARLEVRGGDEDMDRAILERMMSPLEHLLRNAVSHGIESVEARSAAGKPGNGIITLQLAREGSDVVLTLSDDGAGLDRDRIRAKAMERGLLEEHAVIDDKDLYQLILQPGFSTAQELSQVSGRGVGMDVVLTEVKQLGGTLDIDSQPGKGTRFSIRLPFTLAITESMLVSLGEEIYAVPHGSIDGVVRISLDELKAIYAGEQEFFRHADQDYMVRYLGNMLGTQSPHLADSVKWLPMMLVRSGEHRVAIQVDSLLGNRQIVVKSVGAQLSTVRWFTGGTILADGQIAMILDMGSLVRMDSVHQPVATSAEPAPVNKGVSVMVVDDSITVRKVTSRLLERHNMQVVTAKDGVDAVTQLQEFQPDVMLLDIEMPRMDGFELARHMRGTPELADIPIIMITSRTGEKHRNRALELGIQNYLGKPYQEALLLENIYSVLADVAG